jgi:hypothetical protein
MIYLLVSIFISYLLTHFLVTQYDYYLRKIEEKAYIFRGDVRGKFALMKQLFGSSRPDIIFIGNSVTILHINTHLFHTQGLKSFNYATTGYFIGQYPEMVNNAIKLGPRSVVFSIAVNDFFKPSRYYFEHYDHTIDITWYDFYFLARFIVQQADWTLLIDYGLSYLRNCSIFSANGYTIRRNFKEMSMRIQHGSKLLHVIFPHYRQRSKQQVSFACDFDEQGHRMPVGCFNGDAVMIGAQPLNASHYKEKIRLNNSAYNYTLVNIFNGLFDELRKAGIKPYLILIPSYQHYFVDKSLLQRTLRAEIIDLTNIPFAKTYFADNSHYNLQGRAVYSEVLIKTLKPYFT